MTLIGVFDHLRHVVVGEPDDHDVYSVRCGKRFLRSGRRAVKGTFVECPKCGEPAPDTEVRLP